ncbi:MAG: hypothetical protein BWX84_00880 [Verrucomicrobia bacterium ADurb.Bin118]|nr:MAG: hypothetical protein BWX84_00880 [Verrucomicrobia bacterium ADurb.Bin118]
MEACIHFWPRHHIEPDHLVLDDHEETDLIGLTGKGLKAFGQSSPLGFERVVQGVGGRGELGLGQELENPVPHFALIGTRRGIFRKRSGDRAALERANLAFKESIGHGEVRRGISPASLLCATDRHDCAGTFLQQDGGVEDPVLLGAQQFLTVNNEHRLFAVVFNQQLRDGTALANLPNRQRFCLHGVGQGHEGRCVLYGRRQGDEEDMVVRLGCAQLKICQVIFDVSIHSSVS